MRLIDADKLIDEIKNCLWDWDSVDGITATTVLKQTITYIENQPTVLLKEQEAVEPTLRHGGDGIFVWACGSCGAYMYHINAGSDKAKEYAKYCRQCGRKVKWKND